MTLNSPKDLLKPKEVSDQYTVSVATLAKKRMAGTGPVYLKIGKTVLYERTAIEEWLKKHRRLSTSE